MSSSQSRLSSDNVCDSGRVNDEGGIDQLLLVGWQAKEDNGEDYSIKH